MRSISLILFLVLFLACPVAAQDDDAQRPLITADNAAQLTRLAILGRGWINQIAWSPDGTILAVASSAGVWLHDSADLDAAPRFLETRADTWSVAFSPDGRCLAAGGRDMSVRVWELDAVNSDTTNAQPLYDLECRVGDWWKPVESLAFNPDGTVLACASDGVMLWDMATGANLPVISGEPDFWGDTHVAFSPDGRTLATTGTSSRTQAAKPGLARQWDAQSYELLTSWTLTDGHWSGHYVTYSPDGTLLAVVAKTVKLYDVATGEIRYTLESTTGTRSVAFTPDGTLLAAASYGLTLWDVATGEFVAQLTYDDSDLAHCLGEETAQDWGPCPATYDVLSVAVSPDGARLAAADALGRVGLWTLPSGERVATLSGYNYGGSQRGGGSSDTISISTFAFSPDGTTLAAGTGGYMTSGGWTELWNIDRQVIDGYLGGGGSMQELAYSPDGALLVTASALSGVRLWDTTTNTVRDVLMEYGDAVGGVAFSPDGSRVAAGLVYGEVYVWDTATGEQVTVLEAPTEYMERITFSPDGSLLASGSSDGLIRLWDVQAGSLLASLDGQTSWVSDVAFAPVTLSGEILLASSSWTDSTIRLWHVHEDGTAVVSATLENVSLEGPAYLAFSPDGSLLAAGCVDGRVRLWDVLTGDLLVTLAGHPQSPWVRVAFSPDGTLLGSGGWDGTFWVWSVPDCCRLSHSNSEPSAY
jgi:WD40 repeat protein